ncbi:rhodopsin-like orphan GPCR [Schistosoma japonicum]|uniref:Rhodopsin-like orphan GPCR n=1 Tax=Schistosoma japonicum TaxID=6182 RepID=A0A4Z2CYI2_SCHJA|nr:rhodopsin-like orphan GPCR [Schistosoma japonicum]
MIINENDSTYHLFYGFNDPEGQNLALFAISMIKPIPNQKELFLFDKTSRTTGYGGLVSARQLHFICGPYPESIINQNMLFDKIIQTCILPILLILLIIFNSLSFTVLIKPTMRTPVFTVLLSITIIEMFNGILPLPMYLLRAFYNDPIWWENNKYTLYNLTQISKWWKYAPIEMYQTSSNPIMSGILAWTTVYLPTVCHTTVTWLTLFVALQRLIYITYPNKAEHLFTIPIVRIVCISVLLCALFLHIPMFQSTFIKFQPLLLHHNVTYRNYSIDFKQILLYEALDYLPVIVMKCYTCLPIQMFLYFITRKYIHEIMPIVQVTNQTIYLPYTIMELDTVNTMININDTIINTLWIRIVMICNLLILCSYLINLCIFWTMSTPFRLQFNKLFQCKSVKCLCVKE